MRGDWIVRWNYLLCTLTAIEKEPLNHTNTSEVVFTIPKPSDATPSDLMGEFGRMRLTRKTDGMLFYLLLRMLLAVHHHLSPVPSAVAFFAVARIFAIPLFIRSAAPRSLFRPATFVCVPFLLIALRTSAYVFAMSEPWCDVVFFKIQKLSPNMSWRCR